MKQDKSYQELVSERIHFLKTAKALANKLLQENLVARQKKHSRWQEKVIAKNIEQLKGHISAINKFRHDKALSDFVNYKKTVGDSSADFDTRTNGLIQSVRTFSLLFDIAKCSLSYSVIHDLYWISDGTVDEHLDIATGIKPITTIAKYCDHVILRIKLHVIPYLQNECAYADISTIANEVINGFENRSFMATNILLPSIIEGLTRKYLIQVYSRQNPIETLEDASNYVARFQSLETLIVKGDWKNDIPIRFMEAIQRGSYIDDPQLVAAKDMADNQDRIMAIINDTNSKLQDLPDKKPFRQNELEEKYPEYAQIYKKYFPQIVRLEKVKINISIRVQLQFLIRRYKDVRNRVAHGNLDGSDHKWECYLNLSLLYRLYESIKEYNSIVFDQE
jgi:hypothetical protein